MTAKLDFIIGRSGTGKTHACLAAMKAKMEQEPLGPALILLLPEHMTYKVERELAALQGRGQGFFRAYVFGFRRFARQVLIGARQLNGQGFARFGLAGAKTEVGVEPFMQQRCTLANAVMRLLDRHIKTGVVFE